MKEQKPLCVEYKVGENGVYFGWNLDREKINDWHLIWKEGPGDLVKKLQDKENLAEKVHEEVLMFFNGPISVDINIPNNYPYQLYETGKDEPYFEGRLREEGK